MDRHVSTRSSVGDSKPAPDRWATEDDWSRHKDTIIRLYTEESMFLQEVMKLMKAEHSFHATARMYKSRFKSWGVEKYITGREADAMLKVKSERDAAGKPSEFFKHGRKIDLARTKRYFSKKKATGQARQWPTRADTTRDAALVRDLVRVRTPPPERVILTYRDTSVSEKSFWTLRQYVEGNFTNGAWTVDETVDRVRSKGSATDLSDGFTSAYIGGYDALYTSHEPKQARRLLNIAFAQLKPAISEESTLLVGRLIKLALPEITQEHTNQLSQILFGYVSQLSGIVLGRNHPLPRLLSLLSAHITHMDRARQMTVIMQFMADNIERMAGSCTQDVMLLLLDKAYVESMAGDRTSAESTLRLLLRRLESVRDEDSRLENQVRVRRHLAWCLHKSGKSEEAAHMFKTMLADPSLRKHITHYFYNNLGMVLEVLQARGWDVDCAASYRKAVEMSDLQDGAASSASLANLQDLKRALGKFGKEDEAEEVRGEIERRMEELEEADEASLAGMGRVAASLQ